MPDPEENREEREDEGPRRPRVVDKRVSARGGAGDEPPSGETPEARAPEPQDPAPPATEAGAGAGADEPPQRGAPDETVWTPEQEAEARRAAQEMAAVPARDWVLNTAVTLANVAGIKIQDGQLADAQLAIDAFAGMIDKIESQMGDAGPVLRQTLAQLQMAYAQTAGPPPTSPPAGS
jgi:hypothetical protein